MAELGHRVIEMSYGAGARVESGARFLRGRVGMADADDDPVLCELRDLIVGSGDRRQRDHHDASAPLDQRIRVGVAHGSDPFRRMSALAARIDEGSLNMDPERAGGAFARLARRFQRRLELGRRVGDERRQHRSGPEAPMRLDDRLNALRRRRCVEENAATAIDLPIHETRRQDAAPEVLLVDRARAFGKGCNRNDHSALDDESRVALQTMAIEEACADKYSHQRVSVTFSRLSGLSGSRRRRREHDSARR